MSIWKITQALNFNAIWLLCVLGQNSWLWLALVLLILQITLSPSTIADLKALSLASIGITLDATLWQLGIFEFTDTPYWLAILWLAFSLNFGHSFQFLRKLSLQFSAILGALAGCYSYLVSWKLQAYELTYGPWNSALLLAIIWAILLPTLIKLDMAIRQQRTQ